LQNQRACKRRAPKETSCKHFLQKAAGLLDNHAASQCGSLHAYAVLLLT
jgi:hypothetical protein